MFKRFWPAPGLACALLLLLSLAAGAAFAAPDPDPESFQTPGMQGATVRIPVPYPVTTPGDPGDDDIPQRGGGAPGRRAPTTTSSQVAADEIGSPDRIERWRLQDVIAGLRWHWIRLLGPMR